MPIEKLPMKELPRDTGAEHMAPDPNIGASDIETLYRTRMHMLELVKPAIGRKLCFHLEEKLQDEKKALERLLGFEKGQKDQLAKYTLILDSQYFEQIFLNER